MVAALVAVLSRVIETPGEECGRLGGEATCLLCQRRCRRRIVPRPWTPKPGKQVLLSSHGGGGSAMGSPLVSINSS